jgi:hypothetical protein
MIHQMDKEWLEELALLAVKRMSLIEMSIDERVRMAAAVVLGVPYRHNYVVTIFSNDGPSENDGAVYLQLKEHDPDHGFEEAIIDDIKLPCNDWLKALSDVMSERTKKKKS